MDSHSQHKQHADNDREPEHRFTVPNVELEQYTRGPYCVIDRDNTRLATTVDIQERTQEPYDFSGTHAELFLTAEDRVFWQVEVEIERFWRADQGQLDVSVFEVGIASKRTLQAVKSGELVSTDNINGVTLMCFHDVHKRRFYFYVEHNQRLAKRGKTLTKADDLPFSTCFWFAFSGPKSTLYVSNSEGQILWESDVRLTTSLCPFFRISKNSASGKQMSLQVISGPPLLKNRTVINLLKDLG